MPVLTYTFDYSEIGRASYEGRDKDVEAAFLWLVSFLGANEWKRRRKPIERFVADALDLTKTRGPGDEPLVRYKKDEIGWYLYLIEVLLASPEALETNQASRIIPWMKAVGANLASIKRIPNHEDRVRRLLNPKDDPDSVLFELLIGALYVRQGWDTVNFLAETRGGAKAADLVILRPGQRLYVECKRFSRRPDYAEGERNRWLELWRPASRYLTENGIAMVLDITFHVELSKVPADYLPERLKALALKRGPIAAVTDEFATIAGTTPDIAAIRSVMKDNHIKISSSREREVISGRYEPHKGFTYAVGGEPVQIGDANLTGNWFWDSINVVVGAYWQCLAAESVSKKARDVVKRLSEAVAQMGGDAPGIVHLGIETLEGPAVEEKRDEKVLETLKTFDPRGKPLAWVFLHRFQSECPPDELWAFAETTQSWGFAPLSVQHVVQRGSIVVPDHVASTSGAHWKSAG